MTIQGSDSDQNGRMTNRPIYIGTGAKIVGDVVIGTGVVIGDQVIIGHPTRDQIKRSNRLDLSSEKTELGDGVIIRSGSVIYEGTKIGSNVELGHSVIVREGSSIGDRTKLGNFTVVEFNSIIGSGTLLHNGVATAENSWIGDNVWISPHVVMTGGRLMLGAAVKAGTSDYRALEEDESQLIDGQYSVIIENDARVGSGALILSRVRIGSGAVIGAGAVVDHDVPPGMVAAGNPARQLKRL